MKKKLIFAALFLCTLMTFAQFSSSGSGTESDPYLILNPIQLSQMRNYLNKSGVYFKVMADIDLTEFLEDENPSQGWQPVGNASASFQGILDGNGKTVSGLWIQRGSTDYVGLFGNTKEATIKNLKVVAPSVVGNNNTGGFAGYSVSTTFSGCSFIGEVTGTSCVGGYVGNSGDGVTLSNNIASVVLFASGDYSGGFVGKNNSLNILNCRAYDSKVMGQNYVGGACGAITGTIENCYIYSDVTGFNYVGGVCGYSQSKAHTTTLTSCGFVGELSAASYAGGLIGYVKKTDGWTSMCIDQITNSFVIGKVIATSDYVGGLIGYDEGHYHITNAWKNGGWTTTGRYYGSHDISNSYFNGTVSGYWTKNSRINILLLCHRLYYRNEERWRAGWI